MKPLRLSDVTDILASAPPLTGDSLDERILAAFERPMTSAELASLIAEVRLAHADATEERDAATRLSLDPTTPADRIADARRTVENASWRVDRTFIAEKRLAELLEATRQREQAARAEAHRAELIERRDAMVIELREKYPRLVNELADLLARLAVVDAEASGAGLATAEQTARHGSIAANQPVTPLARCRLVDFERKYDAFIWADVAQNYRGRTAHALPADAPSQAPVTKPRQIDVPTLRVEVENRTRGQRMWFANAGNSTVWVNPGCTETAVILESELSKLRENFTVTVLGPGEPARRQAQ